MNKILITGVAGQVGSHLADIALSNGDHVYGLVRRSSIPRYDNIEHIINDPNFSLIEGDLTDPSSMKEIVNDTKPDYLVNYAAQSHVATSFSQPATTFDIDTIGVLNILEAIRTTSKNTRFVQASTSEMFGSNYRVNSIGDKFQDENTEFAPRSPYGVAKLASHHLVRVYRESYNLFTSCIIMFNTEGPRRGYNFVTRKITRWIADFYVKHNMYQCVPSYKIQIPDNEKLRLGNLSAYRDWGYAYDSANAAYLMLQYDRADDFVISTGHCYTIEDFLKEAFNSISPILDWSDYVIIDPSLYRPSEVDYLKGNSRKARQELKWKPTIDFKQLVKIMINNDIELALNGK